MATPDKDDTVEGTQDDIADIEANQANFRKTDQPDAMNSIDGTKQAADNALNKLKGRSLKDIEDP